jgi:hypothetical protein
MIVLDAATLVFTSGVAIVNGRARVMAPALQRHHCDRSTR